ncbi:MAG: hypothetical protein AAFY00_09475, partial [Bacteroidota bacterium]
CFPLWSLCGNLWLTIGSHTETIVENTYDELGQLIQKRVGGVSGYIMPTLIDKVAVSTSENEVFSTASSNAWGNSGFATSKNISGDGYVQFKTKTANKSLMVGLSSDNTDADYTTIDFAIFTRHDASVRVYENGSNKGIFGSYTIGDVFKVARLGNTIRYYKNDLLFYISTLTSTSNLLGDVAFFDSDAAIEDLVLKNADETLATSALQTVDYEYNIRGWLKQINDPNNLGDDLFAFGINYNTASHSGFPLYNGNISETEWRTANADNGLKWYRYSYDALNRIESAIGSNTNYNLVNVDYDMMGNITALNRKGHTNSGATSFGTMDNLVYTYNSGNQLTKVLDNGNDNYGFVDGANTTTEYTYDINGNMKTDANKGITSISYNHLNLPTNISINGNGNNGTIGYIYDATGAKLKKTVGSSVTEYAGNHIYENGNLQFFNHPEGYVTPDGQGGYDYIYQYKDHLGNVRLSFIDNNGTTEIVEENNYYPFGLKHKGYNEAVSPLGNSVANKWKYNDKE